MEAVRLFNHPVVATLLLALAFLGLVVEVRSHGFRRAGWAGLLALALFVSSHLVEGTPAWTAIPLIVGVVVLWPALADPDRRWAATLGGLLLAAGAYLVMVGPGPAHLDRVAAAMVLLAALLFVTVAALLVWSRLPAAARPERRTEVFFHLPEEETDGEGGEGAEVPPGASGRTVTPLAPTGWAVLGGQRVEVVSDGPWIDEGEEVVVTDRGGIRPVVAPAPRDPSPEAGAPDGGATSRPGPSS